MMDDRNISYGLTQLADDVDPPAVDVHAVITAAKAQNRNRRLVGATAVGTMALVGALAVGVGGGFGQGTTGTTAATQPTSVSQDQPIPTDPIPVTVGRYDEQAERLTEQLAARGGSYLRPGVQMHAYPASDSGAYQEWETPPAGTPVPYFLNFTNAHYTNLMGAAVELLGADGSTGMLNIQVIKEEPGLPIDHPSDFVFGPCDLSSDFCMEETLSDGTVARLRSDENSPVVFARRPDGTTIEVYASGETAPAETLVDPAKLMTIVEALTW